MHSVSFGKVTGREYVLPSAESALGFPTPTLVDDAEYAVEAAVLGEADVVRLQRRLDTLERRVALARIASTQPCVPEAVSHGKARSATQYAGRRRRRVVREPASRALAYELMPLTRRHLPRALLSRGVPLHTRWSLLADRPRRQAGAEDRLRDPPGPRRFVTRDDYAVDWETLKTIVVNGRYRLDYSGAVVLDIGSHKGYFGAYALERGARVVISFEPESSSFHYLERLAAPYVARGVDWRLRSEAVGASAGEAALHVMAASWGRRLGPPQTWGGVRGRHRACPCSGLDDGRAGGSDGSLAGSASPLVVKINAEGTSARWCWERRRTPGRQ